MASRVASHHSPLALTSPQAPPVTPARLTPSQHPAPPALAPPLVSLGTPRAFLSKLTVAFCVFVWLHKQSKSDLAEVKDDLSARITDVKTEVVSAETRLKAEITRVETDLKADITRVEDKLSADIGEVRSDLAHLKDNLLVDALKRARNPAAAPQLSEASPQQSPPHPKQLAETGTD